MERVTRLIACLLCGTATSIAGAQASTAGQNAVAPRAADVASADAIIAALYDANTVMVDQKRDADRFRSLFVDGARLMPTVSLPNGSNTIRVSTVEEYISRASSGKPRGGFSEREIARSSQAFGNIMQVFSTYETHRNASDTNPVHGINSIQLFNDGHRWWVVSVLWDNARDSKPIPTQFMPKRP